MTDLAGQPHVTQDRAARWARNRNCHPRFVDDMLPALWAAGEQTGIRPDVLVAQAAHETGLGHFGGVLDPSYHNTAGIKTAAGKRLSGKWAPSDTYHTKIVTFLEEMIAMPGTMLTWLPDVLRAAGLTVELLAGWETRTTRTSGVTPNGIIGHHTATGTNWQDGHVAALLRDGRRDLPGPLAQLGLERDGTYVVIAAGRCNHDGYGRPWGNDSIGIEAYNDGQGEPWPPAQIDAYERGSAAILAHLGKTETAWLAHRESSSHKVDPYGINADTMRARIAAILNGDDDTMVQEIIGLHVAYLGLEPHTPAWDRDVVASVDWHLAHLIAGRPLDDIRKDFASTAGVA